MTSELRWILASAIFLVACLLIGLGLGVVWSPQPVIGVVRFVDVIDDITAGNLITVLDAARADERVAGVVVEIQSPGGYATSSESLYHAMLKVRSTKPLIVSIDGLAASGGYFMAVAGNRIYAPAGSYVGNVGTRGPQPTDPSILPGELSSGPYKLAGGSRFDQIRQLDLVAKAFIGSVVHQRTHSTINPLKISAADVSEARIYLGSEAQALGLIDGIGGLPVAVDAAAELAGVQGFRQVNLVDFLGLTPPQPTPEAPIAERTARLVKTAPPNVLFMLDDRIPLEGAVQQSDLTAHLSKLRATAPSQLQRMPVPFVTGSH